MKKWELPQVRIDQFVANEFVSTCPTSIIDSSKYYAADLVHYGSSDMYAIMDSDKDGADDGLFNATDYESWNGSSRPTAASKFYAGTGWHTNKVVYERDPQYSIATNTPFTSERYFTKLGTFDLYFDSYGKLGIYRQGTGGGGAPSENDKLVRNLS